MIVELDDVYLEYNTDLEEKEKEEREQKEIVNTTKISLEDLQKKLEETQSLRL